MYYSRKRVEELPHEDTAVWSCTDERCNGWMRDNFAFEAEPICQQCQSPMKLSIRSLPVVVNHAADQKELKKGISIATEK